MTRMDSSVLLMHHDPDRSWITDPDPVHPKGTHPKISWDYGGKCTERIGRHPPCKNYFFKFYFLY